MLSLISSSLWPSLTICRPVRDLAGPVGTVKGVGFNNRLFAIFGMSSQFFHL